MRIANVGDHFPAGTDYTAPERVEQWRVLGPGGEVKVTRDFRRDGWDSYWVTLSFHTASH